MFKGVELYSWAEAPDEPWKFVLLPGTNRRKTAAEVLASPEVLQSWAELEARLSRLAPGEEVFWLVMDADGFALPAADQREAIIRHAAFRGIRIHVPHP
jgi:hypothetical protein